MRQRWNIWIAILIASVVGLLWSFVFFALDQVGPAADQLRNALTLYAFAGSAGFAALAALLMMDFGKQVLRPIDALSRDIRTLLEAKQIDRSLRLPKTHGLGKLPTTVNDLIDELRGARREVVRAMATATARMEQEKNWLEVVLLELVPEGVVVCSADDRILLYNRPIAQLFKDSHELGLGRSLFGLVAAEPVRHALERLDYRLQSGSRDLSTRFVCATSNADSMLQARVALIIEAGGKPTGYVLTLADISGRLEELHREDAIRRRVTRELRGPIANLRAAAENLAGFPDMDEEHRRAFQNIVLTESKQLSDDLEELAEEYRGHSEGYWPVTEIFSKDLLGCVARHLSKPGVFQAKVTGEDQWLSGDSHSLMLALESLIRKLVDVRSLREMTLEAGNGENRTWIEIRYPGKHAESQELKACMAESVEGLPNTTVAQILEQHGSEPWGEERKNGEAALRIPLQPAATTMALDEDQLPPRPEFYDFDLMFAHNVSGEMAERPLRELSYVVFDTETTGLKPAGGDEIISIAGVRVTQGRVMTNECISSLVNPGRPIPADSVRFHGITDDKVRDQPALLQVLPRFHEFARDAVLVAHNAAFDMKFLRLKETDCGLVFDNPIVDTLLLSVLIEGGEEDHSLDGICERLNLEIEDRHSALGDALATAHVLVHLLDRLEAMGIKTFGQVMKASNMEAELRFRAGHF